MHACRRETVCLCPHTRVRAYTVQAVELSLKICAHGGCDGEVKLARGAYNCSRGCVNSVQKRHPSAVYYRPGPNACSESVTSLHSTTSVDMEG